MLVARAISSNLLPIFFLSWLFNDILTILAGRCVRIASLYQFNEESSPTFDTAVLARRIVFHPCRFSAVLPATHSLPGGYEAFFRAIRADVFIDKLTVSFFDTYAFAMKPLLTWAVTRNHPSMVVALSAYAEDLSVVVATRWGGN